MGLQALADLGRPRPMRGLLWRGIVLWRRGRNLNICLAGRLYLRPDRDTHCPEILLTPAAGQSQLIFQAWKASRLIKLQVTGLRSARLSECHAGPTHNQHLHRTGLAKLWGKSPAARQ